MPARPPTRNASSVAKMGIRITERLPTSRRLRTSRPSSSVPSQCSLDGGAFGSATPMSFGPYGASAGPNTTTMMNSVTITMPILPSLVCQIARTVGKRPGRVSSASASAPTSSSAALIDVP